MIFNLYVKCSVRHVILEEEKHLMTDDDGGLSLDGKVRARHFKFLLFVFINGIKNLVDSM